MFSDRRLTHMRNVRRMLSGWAILAAAISTACLGGMSLGGCGSSASSTTDPRVAYDDGNPADSVLATPTDDYASKYSVAWWEASAQDYSLVASDSYSPTAGE